MSSPAFKLSGSKLLTKALPATFLLLLVLNGAILVGAQQQWYDHTAIVSLATLMNGAVVMLVLSWTAHSLTREDLRRDQSNADVSEALSLLITMSDSVSDPVFVKNAKGLLVFANPAALALLGKTRDEAMHCSSRELFSSEDEADQIDREDRQVMSASITITTEQTVHLPDGVRIFSTTKAPWLNCHGKVIGVIGSSRDITQKKLGDALLKQRESQLEATVADRTSELRRLADHIETLREEEKRAIARELHDDMGSSLTSLSMHMEAMYSFLPEDARWAERKEKIQTLLRNVVGITRRMQADLRPTMLDLFGLKAAIADEVESFKARTGIECRCSLPDEDFVLGEKLDITLYRMLQEALSNVGQHAHAKQAAVVLDVDEDHVAMTIMDDGVGITPEQQEHSGAYGLRHMQARTAFLGGTMRITGSVQTGTTVAIAFPVKTMQSDSERAN